MPVASVITFTAPLCSGLARRPLKAVARVQIPSGLPNQGPVRLRAGPRLLLVAVAQQVGQ